MLGLGRMWARFRTSRVIYWLISLLKMSSATLCKYRRFTCVVSLLGRTKVWCLSRSHGRDCTQRNIGLAVVPGPRGDLKRALGIVVVTRGGFANHTNCCARFTIPSNRSRAKNRKDCFCALMVVRQRGSTRGVQEGDFRTSISQFQISMLVLVGTCLHTG